MTIGLINQGPSRYLRLGLLLIFGLLTLDVNAAIVINSATVDGSGSTSVAPGATISLSVTVTTSGGGASNNWESTGWLIATASGTLTCFDHANYTASGTYTETFDITAPATGGVFNVYLVAYRNDSCSGASSPEFVLSNAVITSGGSCPAVRDEFTAVAYNGQDGSANWSTDWVEVGDDGSPSSGQIRVASGEVQFAGDGSATNALGGPYLHREADLSTATSATLSFNYYETGTWEGGDRFAIYISADGGVSWTQLQQYSNDQGPTLQYFSADISAYMSANTRVAFVEQANAADEIFYIDNVEILYCASSTTDHLSINHDGTGINCQAETITIAAHTATGPHNIDTAYTGTVALGVDTAHGDWSYVSGGNPSNLIFDGSENGSVVLALANTFVETIDINVTDGILNETSGAADATDDPPLTYAPSGFNFLANGLVNTLATQIAGKASNVGYGAQLFELEAINTSTLTGSCEAALTGPVSIEMAFECENANICQRPVYLGSAAPSTAVAGTNTNVVNPLTYTSLTLDFGTATDTSANFMLNYPDAGQIQLHARYVLSPSGENLLGASNSFIVRPFGFHISVPHPAPPHATTHAGNRLTSAGAAFSVNVAGALWNASDDNAGAADGRPDNHDDSDPSNNDDLSNNTVTLGGTTYSGTPNFGQEGEGVELTSLLFAPAGGMDPGLPANTLIMSFAGGVGVNAGVIFDEVGIIEIAADIVDLDYLGIGAAETSRMTSKSGHVGRFSPAYLAITSFVDGEFTNANVSGAVPFTYIGQDFTYAATHPSFVVSAFSALNTVTTNYTDNLNAGDDWAKLDANSVSFAAPGADVAQNGADGTTPMVVTYIEDPLDFAVIDNGNGTYGFGFRDDIFAYDKDANSQVKPFSSDIDLVINSVTDTDGVVTGAGETLNPAPIDLRFGRLRMENAFGSELNDLVMNYHIEYYDVIGITPFWTRHDDADTTIVAPGDISAVPGNTAATAINPGLLPGKHEITLSASLVEVVETITSEVDSSGEHWLQYDWDEDGQFDDNPSALATFGIYEGDPVQIYIQQIYQ
jgi:MSHA biogenesis protein MshQ